MDTKSLERFATKARRDLLSAVDARATAVLATGSVARAEQPEVVRKLESEITAHGREHVIDKVAYTWFNRIIALRFMDARGYTDACIVSPAQGQAHGQPEILAEAKRGNLDIDILSSRATAETILSLLDGTRRSTDAEGEAYALLLTEYCRHWHKSMPFMFERKGDYTELLVPAGLLADGALLSGARVVLTDEVCDDVEVIGWLYQFYISERKEQVFAGFGATGAARKPAGPDEIPAATQLFTPHWIVRYLVENSLGRLWMLNRPNSRLIDQMDYFIPPIDEVTDFLKVAGPEELTVIDPACGSGHMLTYAFDLLYTIYEEAGYAPSDIPSLILTHNLHGTEIDPRAASLAAFALAMKARAKQRTFFSRKVEPRIIAIEPMSFESIELNTLFGSQDDRADLELWNQFEFADTFGALIQPDVKFTNSAIASIKESVENSDILYVDAMARACKVLELASVLSQEYAIVVANPPYMGAKNMDARLTSFVKREYPAGRHDLYGCFVLRALKFVAVGGFVAQVIGDTWMSIVSFEALRERVLAGHSIDSFVHLRDVSNHPDVFGANAAFVLAISESPRRQAPFIRLSDLREDSKRTRFLEALDDADAAYRFSASLEDFAKVPGSPIAYWLSSALRDAFTRGRPLAEFTDVKAGVGTRDDGRFMRFHWEVSRRKVGKGLKWLLTDKAGEFRKWYAGFSYIMNWENDGHDIRNFKNPDGSLKSRPQNLRFLYQPGVTWGKVGSGETSFRYRPEGLGFNDAAPTIFGGDSMAILMQMNSSACRALLEATGSTLNVQTGMVEALPSIEGGAIASPSSQSVGWGLVEAARADWNDFETSWEFSFPSWLMCGLGKGQHERPLAALLADWSAVQAALADAQLDRETENNRIVAREYGLENDVPIDVPKHRVSLSRNVAFRYGKGKSQAEYASLERADVVAEIVSYAVGCMFGRYSLDEPGLILGDQGATYGDYRAKVPLATFSPDIDNVIPIVDDGWFEDDVVERFRKFLRLTFGGEHFEENVRFIEESLGVKSLRDYFISKAGKSRFFDDHVQRYRKRPIYWMFSSPKGSFNALVYMHRYNASTVSTVLNEYLREYRAKLEVALANAELVGAAGSSKDQKEADRLRTVLAELSDYEHDVLYPLATQQIAIDLDDGVRVNYPKFYPALRKIAGLEAAE